MKKIAMIGVGKLGQDCAEVMSEYYDVVGYDIDPRSPSFPMRSSIENAVYDRDIIFIAAPTPHDPAYGGEVPTSHLPNKDFDYSIVSGILAEVNKHVTKSQLVVLISTVLPGTVRRFLAPCITNARFIYNPYLIAMGTIKWDMVNPEMVIIGTEDGSTTGDAKELIDFYEVFIAKNTRYEVGTWDEAESIKIFYNTFISTKIALVNMIQDVAETNGNINVDIVTNALANSTHRIMGPAYMKAGMGDGGACHPRDNIALRYLADNLNLGYDIFDCIMQAREIQAERMALRCLKNGTNVTIIGKAYKPKVPFINGSPSMLVGHYIEKHGGTVHYYDPNTGDTDLRAEWTHVYLIGYWDDFVKHVSMSLPAHATIIDPWRTNLQFGGFFSRAVINYGNTRPVLPFQTPKEEEERINTFLRIAPDFKDTIESVYLITQAEYLHQVIEVLTENIRAAVATGKTRIVFSCPSESLLSTDLRKIHILLDILSEIDSAKFFYVTGAFNGIEAYEKLTTAASRTRRLTIIPVQLFEQLIRNDIPKLIADGFNIDVLDYEVKLKEKNFLCFNKLQRLHRMQLLIKLQERNLLDCSFYSFEGSTPDWINADSVPSQIKAHKDRFPMRLNITETRTNPIDVISEDFNYYKNSYFSIVTETVFYSKENARKDSMHNSEDAIFFSEKTFKPFLAKHPFILVGVPHSLQALRLMGYRTFYPYIDESYDAIEDDDLRLETIANEVSRLSNLTDQQWINWQTQIKHIVEHNFSVLQNKKIADISRLIV